MTLSGVIGPWRTTGSGAVVGSGGVQPNFQGKVIPLKTDGHPGRPACLIRTFTTLPPSIAAISHHLHERINQF